MQDCCVEKCWGYRRWWLAGAGLNLVYERDSWENLGPFYAGVKVGRGRGRCRMGPPFSNRDILYVQGNEVTWGGAIKGSTWTSTSILQLLLPRQPLMRGFWYLLHARAHRTHHGGSIMSISLAMLPFQPSSKGVSRAEHYEVWWTFWSD